VWQDDRSQFATRLEHEGVAVGMRELDARTYYGVDERGAFAMRGGSVLFVPGVKRPAWPRGTTSVVNPDEARVLKAGYSSEKSAWVVGETAPGDPKAKEFPWWLIGAIVGAIVLFGLIMILRAKLR
jgi:hypothetical protein